MDTLILAAGMSQRMGAVNKLLLDAGGLPLITKVAKVYGSVSSSMTVVTGYEGTRVQQALIGCDLICVHNTDFHQGLEASLLYGLQHMPRQGAGVLVGLGDQFSLNTIDIQNFVQAFRDDPDVKIMMPMVGKVKGGPIILSQAAVSEILCDPAHTGINDYISRWHHHITWYKTDVVHFVESIDTPEDVIHAGLV